MNDKELLKNKRKLLPGSGLSWHKFKTPDYRILQSFTNPASNASEISFLTNEMTALCPLTGFPDQYTVKLSYIPTRKCIESKSAKFYFGAFRDYPGFIEQIAEKIFMDWIIASDPQSIRLEITMNQRGGVAIQVVREKRDIVEAGQ